MASLNTILSNLEADKGHQKTAASAAPGVVPSKGALESAVKKTAETLLPPTAPVVNVDSSDPAKELMKIAESLVGAEKQAEKEEMRLLGSAFADGAITKFAQFETEMRQQAILQAEKTAGKIEAVPGNIAAVQGITPDLLVKIASEIGYQDTLGRIVLAAEEEKKKDDEKEDNKDDKKEDKKEDKGGFPAFLKKKEDKKEDSEDEKMASSFGAGYNEAVLQVKNAAAFEFYKGAAIAETLINQAKLDAGITS